MTSHELAVELRALSEFLTSRPDFEVVGEPRVYMGNYHDKDKFLAAVRATKPGVKLEYRERQRSEGYDEHSIAFTPSCPANKILRLTFEVKKALVCELVAPAQPAQYRCEPLLSEAEDAEMEQTA